MILVRLFNFIGMLGLSIMGWLIVFKTVPAGAFSGFSTIFGLVYGIGFPLLFLWIYLPMFRKKGWRTFTEIFNQKPETEK